MASKNRSIARKSARTEVNIANYETVEEEDEEDDEIIDILSNSNNIVGMRVVSSTRSSYLSIFNYISEYCKVNIPSAVTVSGTEATLNCPMSFQNLQLFFSKMAEPRSNGSVKAKSTIQSYVSNRFNFRALSYRRCSTNHKG